MCLSVASDSSETVKVIIITLGRVTASDMHHAFIILTLTFIQGHADLNRENLKRSIMSETVQAMPIVLAVNIVRQKVSIMFSHSSDYLAPHSRSQLLLILDKCFTCTITAISRTVFMLWHSNLARQ